MMEARRLDQMPDAIVRIIEWLDEAGEPTRDEEGFVDFLVEDRETGARYIIDRALWEAKQAEGFVERVMDQ